MYIRAQVGRIRGCLITQMLCIVAEMLPWSEDRWEEGSCEDRSRLGNFNHISDALCRIVDVDGHESRSTF